MANYGWVPWVLSFLSLVVAALSAWRASRAVKAAEASAVAAVESASYVRSQTTVNLERRHDELDRKWEASIVKIPNTPSYQLKVLLVTSRDVDSVHVEMLDAYGLSFRNGQPYVPDSTSPQDAWHRNKLRQGEAATWTVALDAGRTSPARLRITSNSGEEMWSCISLVDVPLDVSESFH